MDVDGPGLVDSPALHRLLAPAGIVVLEHSPRVVVRGQAGPLRFVRTREYGDSAVSFWQAREEGDEE
jgi:16S rRNA G966 N2-methylase RsmD